MTVVAYRDGYAGRSAHRGPCRNGIRMCGQAPGGDIRAMPSDSAFERVRGPNFPGAHRRGAILRSARTPRHTRAMHSEIWRWPSTAAASLSEAAAAAALMIWTRSWRSSAEQHVQQHHAADDYDRVLVRQADATTWSRSSSRAACCSEPTLLAVLVLAQFEAVARAVRGARDQYGAGRDGARKVGRGTRSTAGRSDALDVPAPRGCRTSAAVLHGPRCARPPGVPSRTDDRHRFFSW